MSRLMMLDSGAFTVWSQGAFSKKKGKEKATHDHKIDIDGYIDFCRDHPLISYYVNLDVIPGKPRNKRSLTKESIEASCLEGWRNFVRMEGFLQRKKIIPVFHQNDSFKWLERYLNAGVGYIGISPANDATVSEKMRWLKQVKPYIFSSTGDPLVRTHGFAVTTFHLMKFWKWYSVDSASWKLWAAWSCIYIPVKTKRIFDYSETPLIIGVSPASKKVSKHQHHIMSASPGFKETVKEYLASCGLRLGKYEIVKVKSSYKLEKGVAGEGEVWYRKHESVLRPLEHGVMTSFRERAKANITFVKRMEKVLPVEHIYFAGAPMPLSYKPCLETAIKKRLLSFHEIGAGRRENSCLNHHLNLIEEEQSNV